MDKRIYGAVAGDIIGSYYEWHNAQSKEDIKILESIRFTDDTVMTCAVSQWLKETNGTSDDQTDVLIRLFKSFGRKHPYAGYGSSFKRWFMSEDNEPYNSFGNGAGMRVSPCGFFAETMKEALDLAKKSAEVSHNHEEGIKGAQSIAASIFLAKNGKSKEEIKDFITNKFGYDLSAKVDDIHGSHSFDASCQVTCPEAIIAFLEGEDYMDVIKKAIWIGGDSDTIACMAGGIAAAYYGVPDDIVKLVDEKLTEDLKKAIE